MLILLLPNLLLGTKYFLIHTLQSCLSCFLIFSVFKLLPQEITRAVNVLNTLITERPFAYCSSYFLFARAW